MLTTLSLPNIQTPAPPQTAALQGVPSPEMVVATRITHRPVAANSAPMPVYNNSRQSPAVSSLSEAVAIAPAAAGVLGLASPRATTGILPQMGFSSAFIAQLLAQAPANDNSFLMSVLSNVQPRSLTPDQALLERFSFTKYMPSTAFKPEPQPHNIQPVALPAASAANAAPVPVRPAMALLPAESPAGGEARAVTSLSIPAVAAPVGRGRFAVEPITRRTEPVTTGKGELSMLRPRGVEGYQASQSRNDAYLKPAVPVAPRSADPVPAVIAS